MCVLKLINLNQLPSIPLFNDLLQLEEGDHMMSPLCDKELDRMEQVLPIFSSDEEEEVEESDPNVSIYSVSQKDDLTLDMSKFVGTFL